jgi:hypothetical protein
MWMAKSDLKTGLAAQSLRNEAKIGSQWCCVHSIQVEAILKWNLKVQGKAV